MRLKLDTSITQMAVNAWLRVGRFRWQGVFLGRGTRIKCRFSAGNGTGIGNGFACRGSGRLEIGRYCAIGEAVRVVTSNHDMNRVTTNFFLQSRVLGRTIESGKRDVTIGNDVWIGDGAIILAGVEIGDGTVIGAGSVVTRSLPPYKVAGGNPARIIRDRFPPEVVGRIAALKWWEWSESEQARHARLFAAACDDVEAVAALLAEDGAGER
ncbi:Acetyltransferase (isoleucine patch superfamily) [Mariprofundus ferrinatatus]|uniref:Acetyltransferase (Isoleucine patch superfamily) n=1 Tax=Mariprofundus ferrinatatus TaxID=1921087 RepID=A0A2K8L290_9PROT|nr:CatB-related O-acetyltransferase [Mariprofundus ferrinatatus]ATX81428.1 Acetyltransferase (isoleucine patch superfamily) [Mariprofundus ferrinatatus]